MIPHRTRCQLPPTLLQLLLLLLLLRVLLQQQKPLLLLQNQELVADRLPMDSPVNCCTSCPTKEPS
jgi:hypothetical protein